MPQIIRAGLDDLIPFVVILTVIITRIMKAAKQGKPLPPPPADRTRPTPQAPTTQPGEDLRQFLQALSGAAQTSSEPPPPPVPTQAIRVTAQPQRKSPPPPPRRQKRFAKRGKPAQAAQSAPQPPPTPSSRKRHGKQEPPKPRPIVVEACKLSPLRVALNEHLADKQSLRGAWLLREVLGPPVGLR